MVDKFSAVSNPHNYLVVVVAHQRLHNPFFCCWSSFQRCQTNATYHWCAHRLTYILRRLHIRLRLFSIIWCSILASSCLEHSIDKIMKKFPGSTCKPWKLAGSAGTCAGIFAITHMCLQFVAPTHCKVFCMQARESWIKTPSESNHQVAVRTHQHIV